MEGGLLADWGSWELAGQCGVRDCDLPLPPQGIDVCSTALLRRPELIQDALGKQLVLFTWGEENNDYGNLIQQKKLGVHAVIYDRYKTEGGQGGGGGTALTRLGA